MVSFHSLWTLLLFICFIGIFLWSYSSRRKADFKQAANLVFDQDEKPKNLRRD